MDVMQDDRIHQILHPGSVAIVGVPRGLKMGRLFLTAVREQGFDGPIYPVNPNAHEIEGLKCYSSLMEVPDQVDLAIVLVPGEHVLDVIRQCGKKGVKGAVLFSSGFRETGTPRGRAMEEEILREAKEGGVRLIGPNCMGLYVPEAGLSFFPQLPRESGDVGLISQSGSLGHILGRISWDVGIRFSKAVSIGNECDLDSADFMAYLGHDQKTRVIGAYLEGVKDGRKFFNALRETCSRKPVVIWKVGLTEDGRKAALSHTGAMGGDGRIWDSLIRQCGALRVQGFEGFVDLLVGLAMLPDDPGGRLAVLSGPGGFAVAAAEACAMEGLSLAAITERTKKRLLEVVPPSGTSVRNPVDVGLSASTEIHIYTEAARILAEDRNVDALVVIGVGLTLEKNEILADALVEIKEQHEKPVMVVRLPWLPVEISRWLAASKIPTFETAERAIWSYARTVSYWRWRRDKYGISM
jgi:acyl-CoA synthetase (NDP forming)